MSRLSLLKFTEDDVTEILSKLETTKESMEEDVAIVIKWLKTQAHLPEVPDENIVRRFLLLNKLRIEISKQRIDMYYTIRSLIPEFYNRNPNGPALQKVMDVVHFIPLPKLTKDLNRVVIFKVRDLNAENFDPTAYIAHTLNVAEVRLREDFYHREIQIYDLSGVKLVHLTKFTPSLIKKASFVIERVFSNLSAGIHFVNAPNFIDSFLTLLKNTLKPTLAEKVFVHRNFESLLEMVPEEILPKEYGGNERCLDELSDEWRKIFLDFDGVFEHLRAMRVNESLRGEPLGFDNDLFGLEGNFKKLNID